MFIIAVLKKCYSHIIHMYFIFLSKKNEAVWFKISSDILFVMKIIMYMHVYILFFVFCFTCI